MVHHYKRSFKEQDLVMNPLIGAEGAKTPGGLALQARPHRSVSDEEARRTPPRKAKRLERKSTPLYKRLFIW